MGEFKSQKHVAYSVDSWGGFFMGQFIFCHAHRTSGFKSLCSHVLPTFHSLYIYYSNINKNVSKIISKRRLENPVTHGFIPALPLFFI